jgi:hypothetical protein
MLDAETIAAVLAPHGVALTREWPDGRLRLRAAPEPGAEPPLPGGVEPAPRPKARASRADSEPLNPFRRPIPRKRVENRAAID